MKISLVRTRGFQRGREIGFPTINFESGPVPKSIEYGVYRGRLFVGGEVFDGVIPYGPPRAFGIETPTLEVHLFGFDPRADIEPGAKADVEFFEKLRGIEKFDSPQELGRQLARDVATARRIHESK